MDRRSHHRETKVKLRGQKNLQGNKKCPQISEYFVSPNSIAFQTTVCRKSETTQSENEQCTHLFY
jgi:hypothetical protein